MRVNNWVALLLRSPLHSLLSGWMMLITVTGRKTGKQYTTPVGYYTDGSYLWVITGRHRKWWRNLQGGAEVRLLVKRKTVTALAELELDENTVITRIYECLRYAPQAARPMQIRVENGTPDADDVIRAAKDRLFIRLQVN